MLVVVYRRFGTEFFLDCLTLEDETDNKRYGIYRRKLGNVYRLKPALKSPSHLTGIHIFMKLQMLCHLMLMVLTIWSRVSVDTITIEIAKHAKTVCVA